MTVKRCERMMKKMSLKSMEKSALKRVFHLFNLLIITTK